MLLVDGFGVLHARGCGSASHLGVEVDLPTVGVAKTLVCMDGLSEKSVRRRVAEQLASEPGRGPVPGTAVHMSNLNSPAALCD